MVEMERNGNFWWEHQRTLCNGKWTEQQEGISEVGKSGEPGRIRKGDIIKK
jgi:hypothetical protein